MIFSLEKFKEASLVLSLLCLAIVLRLANFENVFADINGHLNFFDTDAYYHLRRLAYFLQNFPNPLLFDPFTNWPAGHAVDWPVGFLYFVGIPLKLFGVNDYRSLELGASFLSIVFGLITLSFIYVLGRQILRDKAWSLLLLLFLSTNFLLIRHSCLGQIDHHILEILFPVLGLLILISDRLNSIKYLLWGLLISFSFSVSSSSLFFTAAVFMALGFTVEWNPRRLRKDFLFLMIGFIPFVLYVIWTASYFGTYFRITHPSFFQLSLTLALAVFSFLLIFLRSSDSKKIALYSFVGFVLVVLSSLFIFKDLNQHLQSALRYVFSKPGYLGAIAEANPMFVHHQKLNFNFAHFNFAHLNFGYLVWMIPFFFLYFFKWKSLKPQEKALLIVFSLLFIPGFFQKRFTHFFLGPYLILVCLSLKNVGQYLKQKNLNILHHVLPLAALSFMLLANLKFGFSPMQTNRDLVDIPMSGLFVDRIEVDKKGAWKKLGQKEVTPETQALWTNPNLGHLLHYITGIPTVTNSFYHGEGMNLDYRLRKSKTPEGFHALLEKNKIGYILIPDDFKYFLLQERLHGQDDSIYMSEVSEVGGGQTIYHMDELSPYEWVRLLISDDQEPGYKRIFRARSPAQNFYRFLHAYEVVEFKN